MPSVLLCASGFEAPLLAEAGAGASVTCPGIVALGGAPRAPEETDFLFARQVLPDAVEIREPSVRRLADSALSALLPALDPGEGPWRMDAITADEPADPHREGELRRRAALVGTAFLDACRERRRRVFRRRDPAAAGGLLVQLLLAERERLFASVAAPAALPHGGEWPLPFPAGIAPVADDWDAPSSAFRKLREALCLMGRAIRPGERCVDLGAAPGGWTHVALAAGGTVEAVDRADLDARLRDHPGLTHRRGDAFRHEPASPPVDWLLCDVVAYPEKSLDLLRRWVENGWCRRLVFHLKFKGRGNYAPAFEARDLLRRSAFGFVRAKHLFHDRNEVTLMAAEER